PYTTLFRSLIQLHQDRVADAIGDPLAEDLRVRDEHIVANELDSRAERARQVFPALPIAFGETVLDRHDRILTDPIVVQANHLVGRTVRFARLLERIFAGSLPQLARRDVDRDPDVGAGFQRGLKIGRAHV